MRKFNILLLLAGLILFATCKQGGGSARAMTDFSSLQEVDMKNFNDGIGKMSPFLSRLKTLTGKDYPIILKDMQTANPQGMLLDGLWYTLNADYGEGKARRQCTIVADLPKNNLAAGYWQEGSGKPVFHIEQKEKMAPPFQAWLEDWD
jgi:hypothetical protein